MDHSSRCMWKAVRLPVCRLYPARKKSSPLGYCQSYQIVCPSRPQNSCPAISINMVRLWISVLCVPSVWIIQMRSTFCHGPSWQYISSVGSVGEKSRSEEHTSELQSLRHL